jgi:hypothetical protein
MATLTGDVTITCTTLEEYFDVLGRVNAAPEFSNVVGDEPLKTITVHVNTGA